MPLTRKLLLPVILLLLAYAFWRSSDFKEIASGVAIFLFGMLSLEDGFQRFSGGLLERVRVTRPIVCGKRSASE